MIRLSAPLSLRYAFRDMRGALGSLYLVLICLVLGVGSIAAVQFTGNAVLDGIRTNGNTILGADMIIRTIYNAAPDTLHSHLERHQAELAETVETRVMLANAETHDNTLVELKIVPPAYPLYGTVQLESAMNLHTALDAKGIVLEPSLRERLGVQTGDQVKLGDAVFTVRDFIGNEPDRAGGSRFGLAPRAMIATTDAAATGLLTTGSMVYHDLRIKLPHGSSIETVKADLDQHFPDASWKISTSDNASPQIRRYVERLAAFLTLVGLSALLIGGIGIGNGVKAHLEARLKTIAIMKSLGASARLIRHIYLWQVAIITCIGTLAGVMIGGFLPFLVADHISRLLPFTVEPRLSVMGIALPMIFGFLTSFLFTLWPLGRAMATSPLELFRSAVTPLADRPSRGFYLATWCVALALGLIAVLAARDTRFALWFVIGAAGCLCMFWLTGRLIAVLASRLSIPQKPALRLGVRNLHRPGNATANTLISLGLGLTVMVSITLIEMNLRQGIINNLPDDAPAFFFLDIQGHQKDAFQTMLAAQPSVSTIRLSPNLRGKIVSINNVPADQALKDKSKNWLLQNDRGFTYETTLPAHSELTSGEWWPADYKGPPLVSVVDDVEKAFGVKVGDTITVNILGRDITATVANTRTVNWMNMTINFAITFAPGTLEAAPHSWLATAVAEPEKETVIQRNIGTAFPNISMIRLSDAAASVGAILGNMASAVRLTALVAVVTGILVLAGSLAATRTQRLYDVIVLKVLGIRNRTLLHGFLFEFCLLGFCAGVLSMLFGVIASWTVMTFLMELKWTFFAVPALLTTATGIVLTVMIGWLITGRILHTPVAPHLRQDS